MTRMLDFDFAAPAPPLVGAAPNRNSAGTLPYRWLTQDEIFGTNATSSRQKRAENGSKIQQDNTGKQVVQNATVTRAKEWLPPRTSAPRGNRNYHSGMEGMRTKAPGVNSQEYNLSARREHALERTILLDNYSHENIVRKNNQQLNWFWATQY